LPAIATPRLVAARKPLVFRCVAFVDQVASEAGEVRGERERSRYETLDARRARAGGGVAGGGGPATRSSTTTAHVARVRARAAGSAAPSASSLPSQACFGGCGCSPRSIRARRSSRRVAIAHGVDG
jgi:hypothetical protein